MTQDILFILSITKLSLTSIPGINVAAKNRVAKQSGTGTENLRT